MKPMFWIVKHKEDTEGAPRLIHWHKEAAEAHAAQFKDGFAEVVAVAEIEPLLAANRDLQAHIADLLAQREQLLALARKVSRLNPDAGEIGAGMLHTLVSMAKEALGEDSQ